MQKLFFRQIAATCHSVKVVKLILYMYSYTQIKFKIRAHVDSINIQIQKSETYSSIEKEMIFCHFDWVCCL